MQLQATQYAASKVNPLMGKDSAYQRLVSNLMEKCPQLTLEEASQIALKKLARIPPQHTWAALHS